MILWISHVWGRENQTKNKNIIDSRMRNNIKHSISPDWNWLVSYFDFISESLFFFFLFLFICSNHDEEWWMSIFYFCYEGRRITIIYLPELRDFRPVDRQHCATDASFPHNWHRRIPAGMHRWSTCKHRPIYSSPSNWKRLVMCCGNRWMWWRNSALSLRLDDRKEPGQSLRNEKKKNKWPGNW